ncbi:MAG: adenylate/guanylate cyclase domain-containing protein, partial [Gammaproteobacteria bacterium]|nr:adenylate/guanylate cyclase domain-containing protein [Gammaproteobacteria bacterium]
MDDNQGITVLFADISGSTRLYELIGDQLAEQLISTTLKQLSAIIVKNNGDIIKSIGDELMCRFPCADDAITAAKKMHEFLADKTAPSRDYKLAIRVGAHHGQVIETQGDIFGDSVNIAARVTALARAGKTLITEYTYNQLSAVHKKYCRHFLQTTVKGKEQPIDVYDVTWEQTDELTRIVGNNTAKPSGKTMTLSYGDNILKLSSLTLSNAKLGRGASCDLVIPSPQASREHCS